MPYMLIILWFFGWVSSPNSEAVKNLNDFTENTFLKISSRVVIFLILSFFLVHSLKEKDKLRFIFNVLRLPIYYVAFNLCLLVISNNLFYSIYRLTEFFMMWLTAFYFINMRPDSIDISERLTRLFILLSWACLLLIAIYFIFPEYGAKASGFDPVSGEMSSRLGGSFLRVDLVAAMSTATFIFWLFMRTKKLTDITKIFGIICGGTTMLLAHSRTSIFVFLSIILLSLFNSKTRIIGFALIISIIFTISIIGNMDTILDFAMRGEDTTKLGELNGRIDLILAVMQVNDFSSLILGNGYLMNSPNGLDFYVPNFGRYMDSPHNGYLSVLLGSGIIGLIIVGIIYWNFLSNLSRPNNTINFLKGPMILVFIYLAAATIMDYGIWGVTSPAMLIFCIIYISSFSKNKV